MTPEMQLLGYAVTGVVTLALGILGTLKVVAGRREREDAATAPIIAAARCDASDQTRRVHERLDDARVAIRTDVADAKEKTIHAANRARQEVAGLHAGQADILALCRATATASERAAAAVERFADLVARHAERDEHRWERTFDQQTEILDLLRANGRDHG